MKKPSAKQRVFFFNNNNFPKFYSIKTYEILERNKLFYIVRNSGKNEIFFGNSSVFILFLNWQSEEQV